MDLQDAIVALGIPDDGFYPRPSSNQKLSHKQKDPSNTLYVPLGSFTYGADNRIRTYDLLITNEPLYQLSYTSMDTLTYYSYVLFMSINS